MLSFLRGMWYMVRGFRALSTSGLKRYIILPILINVFLFTGLFYFSYHYLSPYAHYYLDKLPSWLSFLSGVFFILFIICCFLLFLSLFTVVFNIIAAPFNSLLAEKAQTVLYKLPIPSQSFHEMAIRSMKRQGQFLIYYLIRLLIVGLLFFVPFIQPIYPFIWFLFTAWIISIQYQDFAMDNNLISFKEMQEHVKDNKMRSLGFGTLINLTSFIPILNLLIMPAAVIGSIMMYCDRRIVAPA
ncbi:sulfate transporter CysZ [Legionella shakespearei]|uniref:Putative sulfate transport protein CysZ n=1 Tax=Legionella shakespearei DSM 23087 TaxID=1122169 RepID=A0A0W0YWJ1_9GAMM|nr:sulfate transporter CysZ [Legionella shakespearei]KTD61280.1 putative sulfate transport protein CysZ [Legionella shakespearei DSM 23087]